MRQMGGYRRLRPPAAALSDWLEVLAGRRRRAGADLARLTPAGNAPHNQRVVYEAQEKRWSKLAERVGIDAAQTPNRTGHASALARPGDSRTLTIFESDNVGASKEKLISLQSFETVGDKILCPLRIFGV